MLKATSKLFGTQGCSDDINFLDFASIFFKICRFRSSILLSLQVFFPRGATFELRLTVIFLDQSQFFAAHRSGEIRDTKTLNLSCNIVSFHVLGRCFVAFFTLHDQLIVQEKCLLHVEESCCKKYSAGLL